jgi:hypothetical protein
MISLTSKSGLERMTTRKRAKRAMSSFKALRPLAVFFFSLADFRFFTNACHGLDYSLFDELVKELLLDVITLQNPFLDIIRHNGFCDDINKLTSLCLERVGSCQNILQLLDILITPIYDCIG